MVEEDARIVLERIPNGCKGLWETLSFADEIRSSCVPNVKIRLPFSIDIRCVGRNLLIIMADRESEVSFEGKWIYYTVRNTMSSRISLTSMTYEEFLLLHYLEKYAGVLTKILETVKRYSQKFNAYCSEVPNIAAAAKMLLG